MDDKDFNGAFNIATAIFMQFNFYEEKQKQKESPKTLTPEALFIQDFSQRVLDLLNTILGAHQQYDDDLQSDDFKASITSSSDQLYGLIETGKMLCLLNIKEATPNLTTEELPMIIGHLSSLKFKLIESVETNHDMTLPDIHRKNTAITWLVQKFQTLTIKSKKNKDDIVVEQLDENAIVFPLRSKKDEQASDTEEEQVNKHRIT